MSVRLTSFGLFCGHLGGYLSTDGENSLMFHLVQTSYETVLRDSSVFVGINWKTMIADEAHRFKSVSGQTRSVITRMNVMWKLLLTGTLTPPAMRSEIHSLQTACHLIASDTASCGSCCWL